MKALGYFIAALFPTSASLVFKGVAEVSAWVHLKGYGLKTHLRRKGYDLHLKGANAHVDALRKQQQRHEDAAFKLNVERGHWRNEILRTHEARSKL